MNEFEGLNQITLNVRWLLKSRGAPAGRWALTLVELSRRTISFSRATGLLLGASPSEAELRVLVDVAGCDREELITAPLYTRDKTILALNLRHLVDSIPHGERKAAATRIGVSEWQLSRWRKWTAAGGPHPANLRNLLKFHGMDPDLELEKVPLFLSMEPVSGYSQKAWLSSRVQEMSPSEVAALYPALRKLLRDDEAN